MKLQANGVRTSILHALMHTRGVIARPWSQDLTLGACETEDGLAVVVAASQPWSGRLAFDIPRHRLYMGFKRDWPRMNTMPEWFVVEPARRYVVKDTGTGARKTCTGQELHDGLPVELPAGGEKLLFVSQAINAPVPAAAGSREATQDRRNARYQEWTGRC
jgi:hypothetical protein